MPAYDPESYWSRVAEEINKRQGQSYLAGDDNPYFRWKRQKFLNTFLDGIDFDSKVVMEVGPGPGGNLVHIAQRCAPRKLIGIDISQTMLTLAKENLTRHGAAADLHKSDGVHLPLPDQSVDLSFTVTVLQHNTNEAMFRNLVGEICRVTRTTIVAMEDTGAGGVGGLGSFIARSVDAYIAAFADRGFDLTECRYLRMKFSRFWYSRVLRTLGAKAHQEGAAEGVVLRALVAAGLPVTRILDDLVDDRRDLTKMVFLRPAPARS